MSEDDKRGFTVKDRRIFTEEGEKKTSGSGEQSDEKPRDSKRAPEAGAGDANAGQQQAPEGKAEETPLPEVNFPTFVISLNAAALVHLGVIDDPATGAKNRNLPMAKQTIDILSMLAEKTRGNLTTEEDSMLRGILYDLRIAYVKERR
jgi:hypothetical protein